MILVLFVLTTLIAVITGVLLYSLEHEREC